MPGQVGKEIHGGDNREHDGKAQEEIGRQDIQHRGGGFGTGHVQVIGPGDQPVGEVGDGGHHQQGNIGPDHRLRVGPHAVDEDHVEHGNVAEGMLGPELPVAQPGGAAVGQWRGGQQGEEGAAEKPEVDDIKELLVLADDHIAAENGGPAADGDGQIIHGVGTQLRQGHQPPVVGHLRADQREGQKIADALLMLPFPDPVGKLSGQQDHGDHRQNGRKVGRGKEGKLRRLALPPEIDQKFFHTVRSFCRILGYGPMIPYVSTQFKAM